MSIVASGRAMSRAFVATVLFSMFAPRSSDAQTRAQDATPGPVSLPSGQGLLSGLGESFAAALATGGASFTVPIKLPAGRAHYAPSLQLVYNSGAGNSPFGLGWSLPSPFIARSVDRSTPHYRDQAVWHPKEHPLVFGSDAELVPPDGSVVAPKH